MEEANKKPEINLVKENIEYMLSVLTDLTLTTDTQELRQSLSIGPFLNVRQYIKLHCKHMQNIIENRINSLQNCLENLIDNVDPDLNNSKLHRGYPVYLAKNRLPMPNNCNSMFPNGMYPNNIQPITSDPYISYPGNGMMVNINTGALMNPMLTQMDPRLIPPSYMCYDSQHNEKETIEGIDCFITSKLKVLEANDFSPEIKSLKNKLDRLLECQIEINSMAKDINLAIETIQNITSLSNLEISEKNKEALKNAVDVLSKFLAIIQMHTTKAK